MKQWRMYLFKTIANFTCKKNKKQRSVSRSFKYISFKKKIKKNKTWQPFP